MMEHRKFVEKIDSMDSVEFDREHNTRHAPQSFTVDFTIQGIDAYPGFGDDVPRMLHRSSVSIVAEDGSSISAHEDFYGSDQFENHNMEVDEVSIHLPPYEHGKEEEIEELLDLGDEFIVRYGTTVARTWMPPEDWGLTPHIHLVDAPCSIERTLQIIREAVDVTEQVDWMTEEEVRAAYNS